MRNLETRVEKLEQRAGMRGTVETLMWFVDFVDPRQPDRVLLGVSIGAKDGEKVMRPAGEDEEAFIKRVMATQREKLEAQNSPMPRVGVLLAIREKCAHVKP